MTDYREILYEKQRCGVLITLNRPEALNAITRPMLRELHRALDEAEADPEVRAIVITGGGRAFSAGFDQAPTSGRRRDIQWPYGIPTGMSAADLMNYWSVDDVKLIRLFEMSKPVIGAVRGWAMGGGCWLALYTHITIAAEDAVFAQPEVRHGSNTSFMWTLLAGFKNALRYGLVGDHIDAQEALRIGLVNKVVPAERLLEECFSIVERIARVPPETVKINLQIATMGLQAMGLRDALRMDATLSIPAHMMLNEAFRRPLDEIRATQGTKAYLQRRDGPFQPEPFGPRARKA
ncbi:MAG TPA: enoyl-CoA hydratase/isomerase family protein [candidate division Zixibacteria bacterium]|nr:enoyl-CoA hydratase/isomerase family protein [candidate division Zixibacteria bacterium]